MANKGRELIGTVIKDKMIKTRVVKVASLSKHPKYHRVVKTYRNFKIHDEKNQTHTGDIVKIVETRPLSKDKRFRLLEVIKKAEIPHVTVKEEQT